MPLAVYGARSLPSGKSEAELVLVEEVTGRFDSTAFRFTFEAMDGPRRAAQRGKRLE